MSMDLNGINNQNEYYTNHYFASVFEENAQDTLKNLVRQDVLATHSRYFSKVSDTVSYEGIAEGEEADLLPRRGSWFANVVIRAEK